MNDQEKAAFIEMYQALTQFIGTVAADKKLADNDHLFAAFSHAVRGVDMANKVMQEAVH